MTTPAIGTGNRLAQPGRPIPVPTRTLPATLMSDPIASRTLVLPGQVTLAQLAVLYRQRQMAIGLAASRAISALWARHIDPARMADSWASIRDIVLSLVRQYFQASAADSAKSYEQMRVLADLGHRSTAMARLPQRELERVVDSQGIGHFFQMMPTLEDPQLASDAADLSLQSSGARLALKGGRQTIVDAVHVDPEANGWERIISGNACSFCSMLAGRGAVYKSQKSADFRAHDHCNCTAAPLFQGQELLQQSRELAQQWQQVTKGKAGANARKAWQQHWENQNGGIGSDSGSTPAFEENRTGDGAQQQQRIGQP